ncbi:carboxypeptidase regulatory-like domain-containing protein [Rhizobacter sp. LjRoot28]|jgi:hypothetical protein|uniref:carboxypeptidase regulatory-like domain-containing protein n=1 Tax=Rhizobacter sp. LjRoot28 TaxID=3342309 RepID=UPI003ECF4CBB
MRPYRHLLPVVCWLLALPAAAQQLWIEQLNGNAMLRFGDYAENERGTSPGLLDELPEPRARLVSLEGSDELTVRKRDAGFDLGVRVARGQSVIAQDSRYPAWERVEGTRRTRTVWIPAARYVVDLSPQEPALALDVFPANRPGQFKVVFTGRPLEGATVTAMSAWGWRQEVTTDANGEFSLRLPARGAYAIEVQHVDPRPGQRPGGEGAEAYDEARFSTVLTFEQPTGPKAPASLPPTRPAP